MTSPERRLSAEARQELVDQLYRVLLFGPQRPSAPGSELQGLTTKSRLKIPADEYKDRQMESGS